MKILIDTDTLVEIMADAFAKVLEAGTPLPSETQAKQLFTQAKQLRDAAGAKFRLRLNEKQAVKVASGAETFFSQFAIINSGHGDGKRLAQITSATPAAPEGADDY